MTGFSFSSLFCFILFCYVLFLYLHSFLTSFNSFFFSPELRTPISKEEFIAVGNDAINDLVATFDSKKDWTSVPFYEAGEFFHLFPLPFLLFS